MDYPFLQLRHLEKEFRGGPLHLYTLVFRGSLILRGVELPKVVEAMDELPKEEAALEELPVDEEAVDELPVEQEALEGPHEEEAALEELPVDEVKVIREAQAGGAGHGGCALPGQAGEIGHGLCGL
jgi:hypothetical protein